MSASTSRWILWLALVLALPLPMWWLGDGIVPAGRFLLLAAVCAAVRIVEGGGGVVTTVGAVLLAHALVYIALEWVAAHLISRGLARVAPRASAALTLGVVALLIVLATSQDLYRTPFGRSARSDLLAIYR